MAAPSKPKGPLVKRFGRGVYTKLKDITLPTIELNRVFGERSNSPMNGDQTDIEAIRAERQRRIAEKLKEQELKIMTLEGEKEIQELENEVNKGKPQSNSGETEAAAALVEEARLPAEDAVKLARDGKGFVVVKPGDNDGKKTSASDAAEAVKTGMNVALDTATKIAEMGKGGEGKSLSLSDVGEFVSAKVTAEVAELKALVMQAINRGDTKSPDVVDAIERLQKLGVVHTGGGGGQTTSADMLRIQHEMRKTDKAFLLALKKLELDTGVKKAELEETRRRTNILGSGFKRIGRGIARALEEEGEEEEFEEEPRRKQPSKVKVYKCQCGAPISVPPGVKAGDEVTCAKCGATFEAVDTGKKSEKTETSEPAGSEKTEKKGRTVIV